MSVYTGTAKIGNAYLGSTAVRSIHLGSTMVWPDNLVPVTVEVTTSSVYEFPWWARTVDVIVLGAGGGGGKGGPFVNGGGGGAGSWNAIRWTNVEPVSPGGQPTHRLVIDVEIGVGGLGGTTYNGTPGSGGPSNVGGTTFARYQVRNGAALVGQQGQVEGSGGGFNLGQNTTHNGYSPGNYTFQGQTYTGGVGSTGGAGANPPAGSAPGGGGNGSGMGPFPTNGSNGAPGRVWIRVYPP